MGRVKVSLHEEYYKILRQFAQEKYGGRKGAMSKIVEEAIYLLDDKIKQKQALEHCKSAT